MHGTSGLLRLGHGVVLLVVVVRPRSVVLHGLLVLHGHSRLLLLTVLLLFLLDLVQLQLGVLDDGSLRGSQVVVVDVPVFATTTSERSPYLSDRENLFSTIFVTLRSITINAIIAEQIVVSEGRALVTL